MSRRIVLTSSDLHDLCVVLRMEEATDDARLRSWGRLTALARNAVSTHEPFDDDGVTYCGWDGRDGCGELWPCSTVRSNNGEDGS